MLIPDEVWKKRKQPQMDISMEIEQANPSGSLPVKRKIDSSVWQAAVRLAAQVTPALQEAVEQFWGSAVHLSLFSVSLDSHYYWRQDDFHVSQLVLGDAEKSAAPANTALLRISDAACEALLGRVLGAKNQKAFNFKQISPLEAAILNDFSRDLLACLMKTLLKKNSSGSPADLLHFVWTMRVEDAGASFDVGKIVLSVPPQCLKASQLEPPPEPSVVPDDFFFHVLMDVTIRLGQARLPLSELNRLEPGDWVVLEFSSAERMALVDPQSGEALSFLVEIEQKQSLTVPYTQELETMETQQAEEARQNLWDNLMIEVNAEFAPVKLPLQQLKQMSEGLIVEVGDLTHNQIALQVEGKTLAWGELIIVGDKFGVRVTQVESAVAAPAPTAEPAAPLKDAEQEATPAAQDKAEENDGDDDLDSLFNDMDDDDEDDWS